MRKLPLAIVLLCSALCLKGFADTVTLKDGSTVEGKITQDNDTQVTITVQVTDSITDEKVIQKTDIAKIDKTAEDGIAFEQMKGWNTEGWAMLPAESYKNTIDQLNVFLQKYPQSSHADQVKKMLADFTEEQKNQQAGEVKLYGLWIPAKEVSARSIQIQAQTIFLKMKASAVQGDLIGALNGFDQLEKTYQSTRVYPAAIELAKKWQLSLLIDVNRASENLKITTAQWQQGVDISPEPRKSEIMAARKAELDRYDAMLDSAQKAGTKWPPFIPQSQKSLDAITSELTTEKARLLALPLEKMNASIAQTDKASEAVSAKDYGTAQSLLKDATTLWSANEEANYLQAYVTDAIAAKAHPENATKVATVATRPTPKVAGATPTPTPKPKSSVTPITAPPAEAPEKPTIVDFFFTIPGAATIVVCAVLLLGLVSWLQKSKRNAAEEE